MNILQKIFNKQITKALNQRGIIGSDIYKALLKNIGFNNVDWGENTLENVINKGYLMNADVYSIINLILFLGFICSK